MKVLRKGIIVGNFYIVFISLVIVLSANVSAQDRSLSFKTGALVEVLYLANEYSVLDETANMSGSLARREAVSDGISAAERYFAETNDTLLASGGELIGVFQPFEFTDGMLYPENIAIVEWSDAASVVKRYQVILVSP